MRNVTFEVSRDIMSPSDDNLQHNKDNIFMTFRAATQDEMFLYHRQRLAFTYETDWGLRLIPVYAGRATVLQAICTTSHWMETR